jgi:hypothetical protein
MMVVVMVMVAAVSGHDDDPGPITRVIVSAILAVVMMVVVMMVMIELGELHISVRRLDRCGFIDSLQQRSRVRDRLKKVGEGIRPQDVARGRTWRWRGLSGIQCPERRHRSQKPSDLLFHKTPPPVIFDGHITRQSATRLLRNGSAKIDLAMISDRQ